MIMLRLVIGVCAAALFALMQLRAGPRMLDFRCSAIPLRVRRGHRLRLRHGATSP
jgi:hypothetical protein